MTDKTAEQLRASPRPDYLGRALDLEACFDKVESQTVLRAMEAAAQMLRAEYTRTDSGEAVAWRWRDNVRHGLPWRTTTDANVIDQLRAKGGYDIEPLFTHPRATDEDAFAIARAFTAGFKEACEWPAPVVQDIDSPAFGSAQRLYVEAAIGMGKEGES